jgi:hypothetical protein
VREQARTYDIYDGDHPDRSHVRVRIDASEPDDVTLLHHPPTTYATQPHQHTYIHQPLLADRDRSSTWGQRPRPRPRPLLIAIDRSDPTRATDDLSTIITDGRSACMDEYPNGHVVRLFVRTRIIRHQTTHLSTTRSNE